MKRQTKLEIVCVVCLIALVAAIATIYRQDRRRKQEKALISQALADLPPISKERIHEEQFTWNRGGCVLFSLTFRSPDGGSMFGLSTRLHDLSYSVDWPEKHFTIQGIIFGKLGLARLGDRVGMMPDDYELLPKDSVGVISKMRYSRLHDQTRMTIVFRLK